MIKTMTANTRIATGTTSYRVRYESKDGRVRERVLSHNDPWPMSVVKFFTADDTTRTRDEVIGEGQSATRYERFEKA